MKNLTPLAIHIAYGAQDNLMPPERSERIFKMLKASGATKAELRIPPGKDHGIGSALADEGLYTSLHKLTKKNKTFQP